MGQDFLQPFYSQLARSLSLRRAMTVDLPPGVTAQLRTDGQHDYVFVLNFNPHGVTVPLDRPGTDLLTGNPAADSITLPAYGVRVLKRKA
jgi:beta-galactosidase